MNKCCLLLALLATAGRPQDISRDLPYLSGDILKSPVAVKTERGDLLMYEMFLANWYGKNVTVNRVQVMTDDQILYTLEGQALEQSAANSFPQTGLLSSRQSTALFLSFVISPLPSSLNHRIRFRVENEAEDTEITYRGTPIVRNTLRLRPPLRGGVWVVVEGPGANNHHNAGILQVDGRHRVPQRFAIDFFRVVNGDEAKDREIFAGDGTQLPNYPGYGTEVLAVADARVAVIRNDVPDNPAQAKGNVLPDTLANLGGNRVILDLGGGHFASYLHLKQGSVRVKPGDSVKAGQVLGLLGNSASPYPHLHFQVNDGPEPFMSQGEPYVFDSFIHEGKTNTNQIPMDTWLISFDDPLRTARTP